MSCPKCSATDCIEIEINVKEANLVQFYSCRNCEMKWWVRDGDSIELDDVLTLAQVEKTR